MESLIIEKLNYLPNIPITDEQKIWLYAIWCYLIENNRIPQYKQIRQETSDKTGIDFDPNSIDQRLAKDHATEITLLGVLHIVNDLKVLQDINAIIYANIWISEFQWIGK